MTKTLQEWVQLVCARPLPVLRRTQMEMAKLARQSDRVSNDDIASLAYHDPLLTCAILQRLGAMPRRGLASEVTTVDHAVMMLGMTPFFEWVKKLPVLEEEVPADDRIWLPMRQAMARAYHVGSQALDWAVIRSDAHADEVFIAGLLDNLAELLLWTRASSEMRAVRRLMRKNNLDMPTAFARHFDYSYDDFRKALVQALKLPELYVDFAGSQDATRARGVEVILAARLGRLAEKGWWQEAWSPLLDEICQLVHKPLDEVSARLDHVAVHVASKWQWYSVAPAAAWLPMLPGEWPAEPDDDEPGALPTKELLNLDSVCLMPHPDMLKKAMDEISTHLDGTFNLNQLMARVMTGMHEGLALDRVAFALIGSGQKHVKVRFIRGIGETSPLRKFEFLLADTHLFSQLMKKMQGVWLQESNQARLRPMIPDSLIAQIGEGEFYAMSVFVHGKPVGLFYADRRHNGCALDEHSYQGFKQMVLKAAEGMAHLSKKPAA